MRTIKVTLRRNAMTYDCAVSITEGLSDAELAMSWLHDSEKQQISRFTADSPKQSYVLGRLAAKSAILNISRDHNPRQIYIQNGGFSQPIIINNCSNLGVSISHTKHYGVAIAFPESYPSAIDIQEPIDNSSSRHFLFHEVVTSAEMALLNRKEVDDPMLRAWSAKE